MQEIWFRTGEATVLAAEGQYTDAMPEVLGCASGIRLPWTPGGAEAPAR